MKISKNKGTGAVGTSSKGAKNSSTSAIDFRHILQSQLQGTSPVVQSSAPSEVAADREVVPPQLRMEGVRLAEASIDSLDAFAAALADATFSAADLEPFITALEEESQGLIDINVQLPKDDPLAQLIEQVATSCFLETSKFRRGDYQ